jgi:membrane protease YdiL (CAAX protease family)
MAFGCLLALMVIGRFPLKAITGIDLFVPLDTNSTNPQMIVFLRGLLLLQFLGLFLLPSLLFAYVSDPKPVRYLGMKQPQKQIFWILAIVVMFAAIPMVEYIGALNQKMHLGSDTQKWMKGMEEEAAKQIQFMLAKHTVGELLTNLVFISLFAGIGEELFFRGILQRMFIRAFKNPWMGIVFTAAIFSAFHFQFFGFFPRLALGVVLGAIYWYSGSIWAAIIAHFIYDGFIIVLAYFNPSLVTNPDESIMSANNLLPLGIVSLIATVFLLWQMKKNSSVTYDEIYRDDKPSEIDKLSF